MNIGELLPLIIPVLAIDLLLKAFAVYRIFKDEVNYFPKYVWVLVVLFISAIGPILFLTVGRKKE